jgi:hypothetical protein
MSETKHTPEPWLVNFNSMSVPTISAKYERIALVDTCGGYGPANARRIVACVNACAGMADPEAEIDKIKAERDASHAAEMAWERAMMAAIGEDGIKSVSEAIAKLKAERDELLAALETFRCSLYFERNTDQAKRLTIAAIDKARGTA